MYNDVLCCCKGTNRYDTFQTLMHCIFRHVAHRVYPSVYTDDSHHWHHRVCPAHQVDFIFPHSSFKILVTYKKIQTKGFFKLNFMT